MQNHTKILYKNSKTQEKKLGISCKTTSMLKQTISEKNCMQRCFLSLNL